MLKQSQIPDFSPVSRTNYDEMRSSEGIVRTHYQAFADWLQRTPAAKIAQKRDEAERAFHRVGITFAVYGEDSGNERLIPFDIVPRIIPGAEWRMDGVEWNTAALGKKKRELSEALLRRLKDAFAKGGFIHDGQGKWYPGEVLPRWAIGVYWRTDGEPLWRDPALIADPRSEGSTDLKTAETFTREVTQRLGLPATLVVTAYEDVPKLLLDEAALPDNVDPLKADLSLPGERARLARLLLAGLDKPAGFVLPLKAASVEGPEAQGAPAPSGWESSTWPLRRQRLYAVGGDSPLGLRLPLSSLPDVLPADAEVEHAVDPFAPRGTLAARGALGSGRGRVRGGKPREIVKTALTVQVRGGHLYVFMCAALAMPFIFKSSYDKANRSSAKSYRGPGMLIDENSRAPGWDRRAQYTAGIDAGLDQVRERDIGERIVTDGAIHAHIGAASSCCERLVCPLATGQYRKVFSGDRFPGIRTARDPGDEVDVDRAENDNHAPAQLAG